MKGELWCRVNYLFYIRWLLVSGCSCCNYIVVGLITQLAFIFGQFIMFHIDRSYISALTRIIFHIDRSVGYLNYTRTDRNEVIVAWGSHIIPIMNMISTVLILALVGVSSSLECYNQCNVFKSFKMNDDEMISTMTNEITNPPPSLSQPISLSLTHFPLDLSNPTPSFPNPPPSL
eukprot:sb/3471984/